ncbi:hypothetical protein [Plantactinospora sp. GCM10030261]|uniref:hypothetical protein n=1 Tax=Plantactinospora sp. GCM10030261 TaxID=3273420 RepID=UPI0036116CD8
MVDLARYDIVSCVVTGHVADGVLVRLTTGEDGLVERDSVEEAPPGPEHRPPVGTTIPAVVLGTRDGRIRLGGRPGYVALVREVDDPEAILGAWARVRAADEAYAEARGELFDSPDAAAVLRWALNQAADSPQVAFALRALRDAPAELQLDLAEELRRLSADERHGYRVRQVLAGAGRAVPDSLGSD